MCIINICVKAALCRISCVSGLSVRLIIIKWSLKEGRRWDFSIKVNVSSSAPVRTQVSLSFHKTTALMKSTGGGEREKKREGQRHHTPSFKSWGNSLSHALLLSEWTNPELGLGENFASLKEGWRDSDHLLIPLPPHWLCVDATQLCVDLWQIKVIHAKSFETRSSMTENQMMREHMSERSAGLFLQERHWHYCECVKVEVVSVVTLHREDIFVVVSEAAVWCAYVCVCACACVNLVLELSNLVPELGDVLSRVGVVQLALDQPFLLLKYIRHRHVAGQSPSTVNSYTLYEC